MLLSTCVSFNLPVPVPCKVVLSSSYEVANDLLKDQANRRTSGLLEFGRNNTDLCDVNLSSYPVF